MSYAAFSFQRRFNQQLKPDCVCCSLYRVKMTDRLTSPPKMQQ